MKVAFKAQRLTDLVLSHRLRRGCPYCDSSLELRQKKVVDNLGESRVVGTFFACKKTGKGCRASYVINLDDVEGSR